MFATCLEGQAFNSEKDSLAPKEPTAYWWRRYTYADLAHSKASTSVGKNQSKLPKDMKSKLRPMRRSI